MTPSEEAKLEAKLSQIINQAMQLHTSETNNKLSEINAKIDVRDTFFEGELKVIKVKLESIEEQTKKTNGRVTKLEDNNKDTEEKINGQMKIMNSSIEVLKTNDIEHILHCPNLSRIKDLEDTQLTNKSILKFIVLLLSGLSALALIIIAAYQAFFK